jgi:spore coat protein U-like protein
LARDASERNSLVQNLWRETCRPAQRVGLRLAAAALGAAALWHPARSVAQVKEQRSGTFLVSTQVADSCMIAATPMAFGAYSGALLTTTSTLTVTCTMGAPYNVGLSAGTAAGATVTTRQMISGANRLAYGLFRDSGRTMNWGMTVGADTVASVGNDTAQALTVFGRIPPGQSVAAGAYSDTIVATVTY